MTEEVSRKPRYAARLNAFKPVAGKGGNTIASLIACAGRVGGLDAADLNYPDHFAEHDPATLSAILADNSMVLNGLAMRYYTDPGFKLGAFTHPDASVRQAAVDVTKKGIDALSEMNGNLMTLWMGQDGFDYSFQGNYKRMWDNSIEALREVADHNSAIDIAIEYKPNEPRAFSLMPDVATTLLGVREAGRPNLGVTLDFAHVLYADEMPAHAAHLVSRHSRLLGVHLNDGYAKRDDGLMVGSVHPVQTVELLVALEHMGYDGVIYFDTFPDHGGQDAIEEARTNLVMVKKLREVAAKLSSNTALDEAIARQDATASTRIVASALYGS